MRKLSTLLLLLLIAVGAKAAEFDLSIVSASLDKDLYLAGDEASLTVNLANNGTRTISGFTIEYSVDGGEAVTTTFTTTLNATRTSSKRIAITIPDLGNGTHTLTVKANLVRDDVTDEDLSNNEATYVYCVYNPQDALDRKVLLEHFTTIRCTNCPYGDAVLEKALADRTDVVWVAHHAGYGTDELTVSGSSDMVTNFSVSGAPSAMLDRTVVSGTTPPFGIGYTDANQGAPIVTTYIEKCLNEPTFVGINSIKADLNAEKSAVTLTVKGARLSDYADLYDNANITIYLVEDNCYAIVAQTGDTSKHYHDNVIRAMVTPTMGTPIQWNGNDFEYTATAEISEKWNTEKMRVVAIINKPYTTAAASQIYNCDEAAMVYAETDTYDMQMEKVTLDEDMYAIGSSATARATVKNIGTVALQDYAVDLYIDDALILTKEYSSNLNVNSASAKRLVFNVPTDLTSGEHALKATVRLTGDVADMDNSNDSAETIIVVYDTADTFPKKVLLEQFTTIQCVNCPYGDNVLDKFTEDRSDVVWVAHHVGYYTDELTLDDSSTIMYNFGVGGAPYAMLNRTYLDESDTVPPFGIGYYNATTGANILNGYMDTLLSTPIFVGFTSIGSTLSDDGQTLNIKVMGERSDKYASIYDGAYVSVYLIEDNCYAAKGQTGNTSKHYHDNVIRASVTPILGTEINWNGNTFTYSNQVDMNSKWNIDNMRVVAFINKPYTTSNNSQVYTAEEAKANSGDKVQAINADNYNVSFNNGTVAVSGASNVEVYSIDGRRVANSNLNNGLYLIRFTVNGKVMTIKRAF
jgi:hypothetical protein